MGATMAPADTDWTGDVIPADPATWTASDNVYIGRTGTGSVTVDDDSDVVSRVGYLGEQAGSSGVVTVSGPGSIWANSRDLKVGNYDGGALTIDDGGLVSVAGALTIDMNRDGDGFINMTTGGKLALYGQADDSLGDFLDLIYGTDAIRYWDGSGWAPITGATPGVDYKLNYLTTGDLEGYTLLTVPEPATLSLLALGGLAMIRRRSRR